MDDVKLCPECGGGLDRREGPLGISYQCLAQDCFSTFAPDEIIPTARPEPTPELLPVVQADRDAAADYLKANHPMVWNAHRRIQMREFGKHDDHPLVQLCASIRIEHSTPDRNAMLAIRTARTAS